MDGYRYEVSVLGKAMKCIETLNAQLLIERGATPTLPEAQRIRSSNPHGNTKIAFLISRGAKLEDVWGGRCCGLP